MENIANRWLVNRIIEHLRHGELGVQHETWATGCGAGALSIYWNFLIGFPSGTSVGVLTDKCKEYWDKRVKSNGNQ